MQKKKNSLSRFFVDICSKLLRRPVAIAAFSLLLATSAEGDGNCDERLFPGGYRMFPAGGSPRSVTADDFNGDGITDLATANTHSDGVSVLLGVGDGTFLTPQFFAVGTGPVSITAGDFDGDGMTDLATANATSMATARLTWPQRMGFP
jgi:hypothetical protein